MRTPRSRLLLLTAATLLLVSGEGYRRNLALAVQPCDTTPDPCFTNVNDILQGRRILLPVDDLAVPSTTGGNTVNYILQTTSSQISGQSTDQVPLVVDKSATAVGRMFDLPRDVIVTMTAAFFATGKQSVLVIQDPTGGVKTIPDPLGQQPNGMIMADFTGDGFDDIALLSGPAIDGPPSTDGLLRFVTANNRESIADGVVFSDGVGPFEINFAEPIAITAGDFNGDGEQEVAIGQPFPKGGAQYIIQIYQPIFTEDGKISSLRRAVHAVIDSPGIVNLQLVAGNFDGAIDPTTSLPRDELMAAIQNTSNNLVLQSFRVSTQSTDPLTYFVGLTSTFVSPDTLTLEGGFPFFATGGRLDWFSAAEQVIATYRATDQLGDWSPVTIFTLDNQLNITQAASTSRDSIIGDASGLAVGNFDEGLGPDGPPNLEIARLVPDGRDCWCSVQILKVDPTQNFALSVASTTQITIDFDDFGWEPTSLLAGDTQGRSLRLGPPTKVTITNHFQPEVVLGSPPMHVDWVAPQGAPPTVFNISAVPDGFSSQYRTTETDTAQSSRKSTTSFSYSIKDTVNAKVSFGVPLVDSVTVKMSTSAGLMHDNVVSKTVSAYATRSFDASTTTSFDDHLWLTSKSFNVYYYPVLGQCVACADASACTQPADSCPAGTRPLFVQFSGPDTINEYTIDAATVEWYQPVHEVGNVLSYPWDPTQLQNLFPGFIELASSGETYFTGSAQNTLTTTWTQGGSTAQSSGTTSTFSFDTSVSVSATSNDVFQGASVGDTISTSLSWSLSTLNSTVQSVGESTAVGIQSQGSFQDPDTYKYAWQPFMFGQSSPDGTIQNITPTDANGNPVQVPTQGILRTAFTADPTNHFGGWQWWNQTYSKPDVALNHPARWALSTQTSAPNQNSPSNCLRITSTSTTMDCFSINQADSTDPTGEFYQMKGFFITPAEANGTGPQISQATAGDKLLLQARVYNYSLADMPQGSQIVVQFYVQPWDTSPSNWGPTGNSVPIENVSVSGLPGFNSTSSGGINPNWTTVSLTQPFDTTPFSDQYLVFWVLVVLKDAQGGPIQEMLGHGLTGIPPTVASIAEATSWLERAPDGFSYSNNLGVYNMPFYVAPQTSTQAVSAPAVTTNTDEGVSVETVQASPLQVEPHDKVRVRATLRAGAVAANGVSVFFYDGDPAAGGRAFDHELISHIRAQDRYTTQVRFQPRTCGQHTLFVVATSGATTAAEGTTTVEVSIDPVDGVTDLLRETEAAGLPQGTANSLTAKLQAAQKSFAKGNTAAGFGQLSAFRNEVNAQSGNKIPTATAQGLSAKLDLVVGCIEE